jgi:hypothetical protein
MYSTKKALSLLRAPDGFVLCISPEDKVRIVLLEDVKGEPVSIMVCEGERRETHSEKGDLSAYEGHS